MSFIIRYAFILAPAAIAAGIAMYIHAGRVLRQMEDEQ